MENNWEILKQKKVELLEKELKVFIGKLEKIRSNRISLEVIRGLMVNCQNERKPLKEIANLRISPNHELVIYNFEPKLLPLIKKTILDNRPEYRLEEKSTKEEIYFTLSLMTKEIKEKLVREAESITNEGKATLRQVREKFRNLVKKDKSFSQDQKRNYETQIDKTTKEYENKLIEAEKKKTRELSS